VKKIIENYSVSLTRFGRNGFLFRSIYGMQWGFVRIVFVVALFTSFAFAQDRPALTLNQISELLKNGVSSTRIARLVEQYGVGFGLDETALRRLKADGADEVLLSTVKRMAARYTEEQQRRKRLDAERKKQEEARQAVEVKKRAQEQTQPGEVTKQRPQKGTAATLMTQEDVGRVASLRNVMSTEGGEVSGDVVNNSKQTLRDVQLQILYSWRWNNEYQPGKDDPGRASYYVLDREIPPGQTVRFNYKPSPPFASRADGQFDISVKVVGFAQVFQPGVQR
jgi:hypothetical protein